MGMVQMTGGSFKAFKDWKVGDYVEGIITSRTPGKFGGMNVNLQVTASNFTEAKVNSLFTCNPCPSSKKLDEQNALNVGDKVKYVYEGTGITKTGAFAGKPFHKVEIFKDTDPSEETQEAPAPEASADDTDGL